MLEARSIHSHGNRHLGQVAFAVLCATYIAIVVIWVVFSNFPQLQDYPNWIYQGYLLSMKLTGVPEVSHAIGIVPYPVPNSTTQLLISGLCLLVPPIFAGKIVIVFYIGLALYTVYLISRTQVGGWKTAFLLIFLLTLNGTFWNGYINYQFAVCGFVLYFVMTNRQAERSFLFHLFWSIGLFFTQFMVFWVFLIYFGCLYILDFRHDRLVDIITATCRNLTRAPALALVPSLALSAWYVIGRSLDDHVILMPVLDGKQVPSGLIAHAVYKIYSVLKLGPFQVFELPNGQPLAPAYQSVYLGGLLINIVFGVTIFAYFIRFFRSRFSQPISPEYRNHNMPLTVMTVILLVSIAVAPQDFFGGGNVGERLMIPLIAALFVVQPPTNLMTNILATLCALCLPIYLLFFTCFSASGTQAGGGWHARLFTHRPYEFVNHANFLMSPTATAMPDIGFQTSLIRSINP